MQLKLLLTFQFFANERISLSNWLTKTAFLHCNVSDDFKLFNSLTTTTTCESLEHFNLNFVVCVSFINTTTITTTILSHNLLFEVSISAFGASDVREKVRK
jgi:hypothetical protein